MQKRAVIVSLMVLGVMSIQTTKAMFKRRKSRSSRSNSLADFPVSDPAVAGGGMRTAPIAVTRAEAREAASFEGQTLASSTSPRGFSRTLSRRKSSIEIMSPKKAASFFMETLKEAKRKSSEASALVEEENPLATLSSAVVWLVKQPMRRVKRAETLAEMNKKKPFEGRAAKLLEVVSSPHMSFLASHEQKSEFFEDICQMVRIYD